MLDALPITDEQLAGLIVFSSVILVLIYIYFAWALMTIAKKLKFKPLWMAWVPILNLYVMAKLAKYPGWTILIALLGGLIPIVGWMIPLAMIGLWFWKISERRKFRGWVGALMAIPVLQFIIIGIIAWAKK